MIRSRGWLTVLLAAPVAMGCGAAAGASDAGANDAGLKGVPSVDASDAQQDAPVWADVVGLLEGPACKLGNYTGAFTGTYTSYLAASSNSLSVVGQVDLTLGFDLGENCGEGCPPIPPCIIKSGVISGMANGIYPFSCEVTGELTPYTLTSLDNAFASCRYCAVGPTPDGGGCALYGHFEGPVTAAFDSQTSSFVDGAWRGYEEAALDDAGLPDGGSISDSGLYVGPGSYGGTGTWSATFDNGDP
jgi:hypothetical protein